MTKVMSISQSKFSDLEKENEILKTQLNRVGDENRNLRRQIDKYQTAVDEMVKETYSQMFEAEYQRGWWEAMDHIIQIAHKPPEKKKDNDV